MSATEYRLESNRMAHVPGLLRFMETMNRRTFEPKAMDAAARLYFLAMTFPGLPGGVLLALADGSATTRTEGETVIVTVTEAP